MSLIAQLLDTEDATDRIVCGCEWKTVLSNALRGLCKAAQRPEMAEGLLDSLIESFAVLRAFREAQVGTRDR